MSLVVTKIFNINDTFGIKMLTRLRSSLSTFVSVDLDTVLKTHEIHFVPVVLQLKLQYTIPYTAISIIQT